ncbi:hypothetical protein [Streptomyces roseolus]|uniref:hypothetical protein n=1 Tax=Streptomyces roseolus TaxID=67358 RepID=UPI00167A4D93|nr:hypothetical protein [Streptomyces roseolus]GGR67464.1 hypothetical protein GCM10010282_70430 [Streptomyces roseolus]
MTNTARTRRPSMTPEERAAYNAEQRAALDGVMARTYAVLHVPAVWDALLALAARLEDRSPVNVVAILGQLPEATDVRGKTEWRKVGRGPAKGSKALRVWAPVVGRRATEADQGTEAEDGDTEAKGGGRPRAFKAAPTYDVSQTAGDDYAAPVRPVPDALACARRLSAALNAPVVLDGMSMPADLGGMEGAFALRVMLDAHAAGYFTGPQMVAGQNAAEAASAAHLAALILGIEPSPARVPALGGVVTGERMTPAIKDAAERVITGGRALAVLACG